MVEINEIIKPLAKNWPYLNTVYTVAPAGGINSNIIELANWIKMQMNDGKFKNKQIVSAENINFMHQPRIFMGQLECSDEYYATGWMYRSYSPYPIIWHSGETGGITNIAAFIPQEHIGIVILTNSSIASLSHLLAWQFFDLYFNKPDKDWNKLYLQKTKEANKLQREEEKQIQKPTHIQPSLPLNEYIGIYHNDMYGDIRVIEENNHLVLIMGPKYTKMRLNHWDQNIFSLAWSALLNESDKTKVIFHLDSTGQPKEMVIETLDEKSDGKFERIEN